MKNIKRSVCLCSFVFMLQFFFVHALAATMSDKEFTALTKSKVEDVFCVGSEVDANLHNWWEKVESIKLELNVEKFLDDIFAKLKRSDGVSSNKSKYRKVKIKLYGTECWMSGKYRLTGDLSDHVGTTGEIPHSIKIKITNGKIDNILKFKLFTPKTRFGKLEVLNAVIHQKLGLLAPRTALVDVQIGGQITKAIFQEDIGKQLLEHNNLHEAMLLESDEGYLPLNFPKIINRSFVSNEQFRDISIYVLEKLGQGFQFTSRMNKEKVTNFPIFLNFLPANSKREFIYFHLLNFSLNNIGGLTLDDSKFVFDHISRRFHPIYYDGHASAIISKISDINFGIPEDIRLRLLKDLEAIDLSELKSELNDLGSQFSIRELQKIMSDTISFVRAAKSETVSYGIDEMLTKLNNYELIDEKAFKMINNKNLSSLQISWMLNTSKLQRCIYRKISKFCVQEILDDNQKLTHQLTPQSLSRGIFLYGLSNESLETTYFQELASNTLTLLETETIIEHTSNLELSVDVDTKTVIVKSREKNASTSQIKVSGGILDGWEFIVQKGVFLGYEKLPGSRASKFGLTGCITFNDLIIKSLKVYIQEAMCEDSIHFVRAKGDVESITVNQASVDAIDADFSDITFSSLNILDAGNDCVDFSAGTYRIANSKFHNCGDKGISAGEGSNVFLGNSEINDAVIGIAAKDGSTVVVKDARLFNVDVCLAVYKKKQEYGGALLDIKKILCSSDNYFNQNGSRLFFRN